MVLSFISWERGHLGRFRSGRDARAPRENHARIFVQVLSSTKPAAAKVHDVCTGPQFTTNGPRALHRLRLSKREFNRAIHAIKKQIEGHPDLVCDITTGDVCDQRSGEWIGHLLDDKD